MMPASVARVRAECGTPGAKHSAEKLALVTSGAKALTEKKGLIAALKALRHPKPSFSALCKAPTICGLGRQG
ncbi:hypothetical protein SBA1_20019 [Candidatus Sulfotelmatobacter kueseliae]|uniref:Uncharacterized protein n=1 Tax=Candidatus Sulfotelmatobacter kueseliae TaxID=2042962 RepID=A0A2U3KF93_9BACT|nr:hypothetical protein SBA1_20019 [Candidatus Sulfotelmatobacter kueseliae]